MEEMSTMWRHTARLIPFLPPCGSEAPQHGSAARGQRELKAESVSPLSSPPAANSLFPATK